MTASELETVTWRCIHYAATEGIREVLNDVTSRGIFVARVGAESSADKATLLKGLCSALKCPDYVGFNWDAIEEAMGDLEWLPAKAYVVVIEGGTRLWRTIPREGGILVEVALATAELWSRD